MEQRFEVSHGKVELGCLALEFLEHVVHDGFSGGIGLSDDLVQDVDLWSVTWAGRQTLQQRARQPQRRRRWEVQILSVQIHTQFYH